MIENGVRTQSTAFACSLLAGLAALPDSGRRIRAAGARLRRRCSPRRTAAMPTGKPTSAASRCRFSRSPRAHPGMKVLDMGAGGGYSTELMARAVAPSGVVYAQYPADGSERARTNFEARHENSGDEKRRADCRGRSTIRYRPTCTISI